MIVSFSFGDASFITIPFVCNCAEKEKAGNLFDVQLGFFDGALRHKIAVIETIFLYSTYSIY